MNNAPHKPDDGGRGSQQASRLMAVGSTRRLVPLLIYITVWVILGVCFLETWAHRINPDTVAYISVAQAWAAGRVDQAINAYWSPLISWLNVPLLWVGVDAVWAMNLVQYATVLAAGLACNWLMAGMGVGTRIRVPLVAGAMVISTRWSLMVRSPDLLMGVVAVAYLAWTVDPRNRMTIRHGIYVGVLGGLAYLAKAYALPMIAAHLILLTTFRAIANRNQRTHAITHGLSGFAAMMLMVTLWAIPLSIQYGHVTVGSTGQYSHRINGPQSPDHPMHTDGLLPLPHANAYSVWDDPTVLIDRVPDWSRWTPAGVRHTVQLVKDNSRNIVSELGLELLLLWPGIGIALMLIASRWDSSPHRPVTAALLLCFLAPAGYLLLHVLPRFLAPTNLLLVAIAGLGLTVISSVVHPNARWWRVVVPALVGLASMAWPLQTLVTNTDTGRADYRIAQQLASTIPPNARVASDGRWHSNLYLSFYNQWHYLGEKRHSPEALIEQARQMDVSYLLIWRDPTAYANVLDQVDAPVAQPVIFRVPTSTDDKPGGL